VLEAVCIVGFIVHESGLRGKKTECMQIEMNWLSVKIFLTYRIQS